MNKGQARYNVLYSMESGAAKICDDYLELDTASLNRAVVRAQADDVEAWELVVNGMSRLVFRIAEGYYMKWSGYMPVTAAFCDVFAEAMVGLHRAAMKFEVERGLSFTTMAGWWIRNSAQRACYASVGVGRIPEKSLVKGMVEPDDPFLSALSLDFDNDDARSRPLHEVVPSPEDVELGDLDAVRSILELLGTVDSRLPAIMELAVRDHSMKEIGRIVGISGDRVRQLIDAGGRAVVSSGLAECPARPGLIGSSSPS